MKVSILCIGDELLIGQVLDTNSNWLAKKMTTIGFDVNFISAVSDDHNEIISILNYISNFSDIVLISGGLGPTKDDITIRALASFFDDKLVFDPVMLKQIKHRFRKKDNEISEAHRLQCYLPSKAIKMSNALGTAPGLWFERNRIIYISMPGVPYELKSLMTAEVIPRLRHKLALHYKVSQKTILTAGIGEVKLSELFETIQQNIPDYIKVAFLPSLGKVRIRLTGRGKDQNRLDSEIEYWIERIVDRIGPYVYGFGEQNLEEALGVLCKAKGIKMATAESCTGGYISHLITRIPGSSEYFNGAVVAYSNSLKKSMLNVNTETLVQFGAVSRETAIEMLQGLLQFNEVDLGISVTGIAGPGGGTTEKPVGTIWLAWGTSKDIKTHKLQLDKNREENIQYTANFALNVLRKFLLEI